MRNLIFVGSEATGYYGGAYDCFGVFVTEEYFDKYEDELRQSFSYRCHGELDGKYSDVEGSLVVRFCGDKTAILVLANDILSDYGAHLYYEYVDEEELLDDLLRHIEIVYETVRSESQPYGTYKFQLTSEEVMAVTRFIDEMRAEIND